MGRNILLVIFFGLCILGPCAVFAAVSWRSIDGLARNPSSAPKIFTVMILSLAFAFFLAIVAMLIVFQLYGPQ